MLAGANLVKKDADNLAYVYLFYIVAAVYNDSINLWGRNETRAYFFTCYNGIHSVMPSSVVLKIDYDADATTLRITFVSGKIYAYENVPKDTYVAMKSAFSKGIFFNDHIKGKYSFKKVGE